MTRISIAVALLMLSASAMAQQSPTSGTMPPPDLSFVPEHLHQIPDFGKPRGTRALSEPALRHQIEAIEAGGPDYDAMTPRIAQTLRGQIDLIRPSLADQWGALQSLKFKYPTQGGDVYEARFERARVRWVIVYSKAQEKISAIAFKTLAQWES